MREGRGKDLPFWPDWCFMPLAGAYAIVDAEARRHGIDVTSREGLPLIKDVGIIGALAAWRVTQGVYRFDPDIYDGVINTPLTGDLPGSVLFNLPEWCVYVETPGLTMAGQELAGFFAHLEYDDQQRHNELRLVMDFGTAQPALHGIAIHLGPWPLSEALAKTGQEAIQNTKELGIPPELLDAVQLQDDCTPLVSLILYLCSVNGDIGSNGQPAKPKPKKTKKGLRLFPPVQPRTWDVGVRMGAALREATQTFGEAAASDEPGTGRQRSGPRPHVRRAHWSTYWTGPRSGEQKSILKWIQPLLIGSGESMPVTIRPVK